MTMSASLPASIDPTRLSMRSCFAGLIVTSASASSSVRPPYLIIFAASVFSRRACSALSELIDTTMPRRRHMAAF